MCSDIPIGTAKSTILIENTRTRVTRWTFPMRGDNTGWHKHEYDYVVLPLYDGHLDIETANGERVTVAMESGVPYFRELGVEHEVISANDHEYAFIEMEFLESPKKNA